MYIILGRHTSFLTDDVFTPDPELQEGLDYVHVKDQALEGDIAYLAGFPAAIFTQGGWLPARMPDRLTVRFPCHSTAPDTYAEYTVPYPVKVSPKEAPSVMHVVHRKTGRHFNVFINAELVRRLNADTLLAAEGFRFSLVINQIENIDGVWKMCTSHLGHSIIDGREQITDFLANCCMLDLKETE